MLPSASMVPPLPPTPRSAITKTAPGRPTLDKIASVYNRKLLVRSVDKQHAPPMSRLGLTCDTAIAGLEIGSEVALTRSYIDQRAYAHVARLASGALGVEQRDDVVGTAEIVVAADTSAQPHPPVHR